MDIKTREQIEEYHDEIRGRSTPPGSGIFRPGLIAIGTVVLIVAWRAIL